MADVSKDDNRFAAFVRMNFMSLRNNMLERVNGPIILQIKENFYTEVLDYLKQMFGQAKGVYIFRSMDIHGIDIDKENKALHIECTFIC